MNISLTFKVLEGYEKMIAKMDAGDSFIKTLFTSSVLVITNRLKSFMLTVEKRHGR